MPKDEFSVRLQPLQNIFKGNSFFLLWGDPLQNPRRTPAPEYCISSRKRRSLRSEEGGGFRKEGDGGEGAKRTRNKCSECMCLMHQRAQHEALCKPSAMITDKNNHNPTNNPGVSKQCPADGVWRIGRGGSPYRVLKTRFAPSESSAGHSLPPQRAPKQCPANGVRKIL